MAILNTTHALYSDIVSCAPFYVTPNVSQREDIAPGAGLPITLTKWAGHPNGATFDSVTNKLYLLFRSTPTGLGNSGVISVYQVS